MRSGSGSTHPVVHGDPGMTDRPTSGAPPPRGTGLIQTATDADGPRRDAAHRHIHGQPAGTDAHATTNEGERVGIPLSCSDNATTVTDQIAQDPGMGRSRCTSRGAPARRRALPSLDSFTYHGVSANGASGTQTVTVVVLAPPTAQIAASPGRSTASPVATRCDCADDPPAPASAPAWTQRAHPTARGRSPRPARGQPLLHRHRHQPKADGHRHDRLHVARAAGGDQGAG